MGLNKLSRAQIAVVKKLYHLSAGALAAGTLTDQERGELNAAFFSAKAGGLISGVDPKGKLARKPSFSEGF